MAAKNTGIKGKDKILMFRRLDQDKQETGVKLALQTTHTWDYARSVEGIDTKDGTITSGGGLTVTLSIEAVASNDELNKMLKQAVLDDAILEVWDVDMSTYDTSTKKADAQYAQGRLQGWSVPADVSDLSRISTTMSINGVPQSGTVTLTEAQEAQYQYAFRGTEKVV